jgi:phospholipid-translocating ATPase
VRPKRKLLPRERNYSTIERECLAIVWGIKKFHMYLSGRLFELQTDHQPLTYIQKAKLTNKRIMGWAMTLQEYRFRVVSIPGKDNFGSDFLSRVPGDQDQ